VIRDWRRSLAYLCPDEKIQLRIVTARHLLKHGQKDAAIKYLKQCYGGYHGTCAEKLLLYETPVNFSLDPLAMEEQAVQTGK
jgi:hypothetical protein